MYDPFGYYKQRTAYNLKRNENLPFFEDFPMPDSLWFIGENFVNLQSSIPGYLDVSETRGEALVNKIENALGLDIEKGQEGEEDLEKQSGDSIETRNSNQNDKKNRNESESENAMKIRESSQKN